MNISHIQILQIVHNTGKYFFFRNRMASGKKKRNISAVLKKMQVIFNSNIIIPLKRTTKNKQNIPKSKIIV